MRSSGGGRTFCAALNRVHMAVWAAVAVMLFATQADATIRLCRSLQCARNGGGPGPGIIPVFSYRTASFTFDDGTTGYSLPNLPEDFVTEDGSISGFLYSPFGLGVSDPVADGSWCELHRCQPFEQNSQGSYFFIRPNFDGMISFVVTPGEQDFTGDPQEIANILDMVGLDRYIGAVSLLLFSEGSIGGFECTGPVNEAPDGFPSPFNCASDQYRTIVDGSYVAVDGFAFVPEPWAILILGSGLLAMVFVFRLHRVRKSPGSLAFASGASAFDTGRDKFGRGRQ